MQGGMFFYDFSTIPSLKSCLQNLSKYITIRETVKKLKINTLIIMYAKTQGYVRVQNALGDPWVVL